MAAAGFVRSRGSRLVQRRRFADPDADPGFSGRRRALAYSLAVRTLELDSKATESQLAQNFTILIGIVLPSAVGVVAVSDNLAT